MKDWLGKVRDNIKKVSIQTEKQKEQIYDELARRAYLIFKEELANSNSPYDITEPIKTRDGKYLIKPTDQTKAFEIEFGKWAEGTSMTETEPNQIIRRTTSKIDQMLNKYKSKYGIHIQVKYQFKNPTT